MSKKNKIEKQNIEDVVIEEVTTKECECHGDHDHECSCHEGKGEHECTCHNESEEHECSCGCDCESYAVTYKKFTSAGVFSVICKVISVLSLLFFSYIASADVKLALEMQGMDAILSLSFQFMLTFLFPCLTLWAIGEVVGLVDKIKQNTELF